MLVPMADPRVIIAAGLLMTACAPSSAAVQPPVSGAGVATPSGQVKMSLDGQLPEDWPLAFPVPTGAVPAGSATLAGYTGGVTVAVFTTSAQASQAFWFYTDESGLRTSDVSAGGTPSNYFGTLKFTAPFTGSVTIFTRAGDTYIVAVIRSPSLGPTQS